jgi:DNA helicase-2/ATP-dependent DNA helicase PcrA
MVELRVNNPHVVSLNRRIIPLAIYDKIGVIIICMICKMVTREKDYTDKQKEAIYETDKNLQIIACAGSGKTEVVSARIAQILLEKAGSGISPKNVVAFTFTDRAAAELKDRIATRVIARVGNITGLADMYAGTIHGYCLHLLQTYVYEYLKYGVLNDVQARLLVDRYNVQSGMQALGLKRYKESWLFLDVMEVLREANVNWSALQGNDVHIALDNYNKLLRNTAYFDYTKMMKDAIEAINTNKGLQGKIANSVKYLIVDEYQDINPLQERLIHSLHELGANLCVVGDDDQCIFEWRGTDVQNIITFSHRYPNVHDVTMDENFRSSPGVVDLARHVIQRNDPDRLPKQMVSTGNQSFEHGDVLCLSFANPSEEANWIANKIEETIGTPFKDRPEEEERGLSWSDFAILLRSVKHNAAPIIDVLRARDIPYIVKGMNNLFNTAEAIAAGGIFWYLVDSISEKRLRELWEQSALGLSPKDIDKGIDYLNVQKKWEKGKRWSAYNLQRTYLTFLELIGLREEGIPDNRGEIVYYNLGKFSQVISDYEQINYQSEPKIKYEGFASFLLNEAPGYYPEGWEDIAYARPDAVQIMTIHQAKGQEWPVVFVPALIRNRFPSSVRGSKKKWHVIPKAAIEGADRYDGSIESERRLFYVALTRSHKYLFCTWSPTGSSHFSRPSQFFDEATTAEHVLTKEPSRPPKNKLKPKSKNALTNVVMTFSELKYYFMCPYQFKLRFLYGFNPPIDEAIGYGKSLHDALAEVHRRALEKDFVSMNDAEDLVNRHLHVPFAYPELKENLRKAGIKSIKRYLQDNSHLLDKIVHTEQIVEIHIGEGLVVNGRIDLIRRTDTNETIIVDFKSTSRAQQEDVSRKQLHIYAMGYKELTGKDADMIEIHNLDKGGAEREKVDEPLMQETAHTIKDAGAAIRESKFPRLNQWCDACAICDPAGICRNRPRSAK